MCSGVEGFQKMLVTDAPTARQSHWVDGWMECLSSAAALETMAGVSDSAELNPDWLKVKPSAYATCEHFNVDGPTERKAGTGCPSEEWDD